jgi:pyridoxal phosphate enzyme (YggS family)
MIKEKINELLTQLPTRVRLIAVSKTKPVAAILEAYEAGQRDFGENKVQELVEKEAQLPKDIRWHLIGHLQTNKVKYAASFVYLIHAVDSLKLLQEIDKQAKKNSRIQKVLLQFYIAQEETKFGLELNEAKALLDSSEFQALQNIEICGVMGMASFTEDDAQVRNEFEKLHAIFNELKASYFAEQATFSEISMGMSGDYQLAIEAGSTMIRVGSSIFGGR